MPVVWCGDFRKRPSEDGEGVAGLQGNLLVATVAVDDTDFRSCSMACLDNGAIDPAVMKAVTDS